MPKVSLILGGAKSGKSKYAEDLSANYENKLYIATAEARDEEMKDRIKAHQKQRGTNWQTIEESLNIKDHLEAQNEPNSVILVDCMTIWLSNLFEHNCNIETETNLLLKTLPNCSADVILVSNELGLSIVPENALARKFRDEQGILNQKLAKVANNVVFIAAGLPINLK